LNFVLLTGSPLTAAVFAGRLYVPLPSLGIGSPPEYRD